MPARVFLVSGLLNIDLLQNEEVGGISRLKCNVRKVKDEKPLARTTQSARDSRGRLLHLQDFMAVTVIISLKIYNIATLLTDPSWTAAEENRTAIVRLAGQTIAHLTLT